MIDKTCLLRCLLLPALILAIAPARAADWPNWRGSDHNGISTETGWEAKWPADGPPRLWKTSLGLGFSSVSVAHGRLYTMGNHTDIDTVFCFDAETGKLIWKKSYACPTAPLYYEGGTSATPTIDGDFVYTLSRKGGLYCFAAGDGKIVWSKDIASELGLEMPQWGFASSALIENGLLYLDVGSGGAAFDKTNGKLVWKSAVGPSGYSTPVPYTVAGKSALALMTGEGAEGVDATTGARLWQYPWKANYGLNIADPLIVGDRIFVSSSYAKFGALLEIKDGAATPVWKNDHMRNQINSCVLLDGYLYGVDGIAGPSPNASLACVNLLTGKVKWNFPDLGGGALMAAGHTLIALSDKGELFTAAASPDSFTPISRVQVLGGRCWTVPVLANARLYCRNAKGDLVCLDVKPH